MHLECPNCDYHFTNPTAQAFCPKCNLPVDADDVDQPSRTVYVVPDLGAMLDAADNPDLQRRFVGLFARRIFQGLAIGCFIGLIWFGLCAIGFAVYFSVLVRSAHP